MSTWTDVRDAIEHTIPALAPILGGAVGGPIGAAAGDLLGKALGCDGSNPDSVMQAIADPQAYAKLEALRIGLESKRIDANAAAQQGQLRVNSTEAGNNSLFVAGWRPGVGWVCAAAFAYAYVVQPFAVFIASVAGYHGPVPTLDIGGMMPVMLGMLGLGGMRSWDKKNGVSSGH